MDIGVGFEIAYAARRAQRLSNVVLAKARTHTAESIDCER
ncbi:hypothetical protein AB7M42_001643 [Bradyrhizobium diazoefficiens]|jgi:hypothetical protein|nr:hypothetical protein [Bradyrhizobium japonicum]